MGPALRGSNGEPSRTCLPHDACDGALRAQTGRPLPQPISVDHGAARHPRGMGATVGSRTAAHGRAGGAWERSFPHGAYRRDWGPAPPVLLEYPVGELPRVKVGSAEKCSLLQRWQGTNLDAQSAQWPMQRCVDCGLWASCPWHSKGRATPEVRDAALPPRRPMPRTLKLTHVLRRLPHELHQFENQFPGPV